VINAAVLIILFTCLAATYLTDYAGRKVALQQAGQDEHERKDDHILVPISNPGTARALFDFAVLIHHPYNNPKISPLTIATTPRGLEHSMLHDKSVTEYFVNQARAASIRYAPAMRVDSHVSEGIIRAAVEIQTTHIVLGWSGQSSTARYFFGTIIEKLLESCPQMLIVVKLVAKMLIFRKIYVLVPSNADHETGFHAWMSLLFTLRNKTSGEMLFVTDKDTLKGIMHVKEVEALNEDSFRLWDNVPDMNTLAVELNENDLLVVVSARENTVSYNRKLAVLPRVVTRYFAHTNCMILYPEQADIFPKSLSVSFR